MIALLRLSAGLIGWAVAFCLIYALHGVGCAAGWEQAPVLGGDRQRVVLIATWLACVAATVSVALYLMRRRTTLLERAAVATGWTGVAATIVTFVPIVVVPSCL